MFTNPLCTCCSGDTDCLIGNSDGYIKYYENTGTSSVPKYTELTGAGKNPFNGVDVGSYAAPECFDMDHE